MRLNLNVSYAKVNSEWIINLNVNHKAVKHLEESTGKSLLDLEFGREVLDIAPKVYELWKK